MNKKILTIILGTIFLLTSVLATNEIYNLSEIDLPSTMVGGDTIQANFSFDYLNNHENTQKSPLIIQLNFSSMNENYSVWRGDFEVSGKIEKYTLWGIIHIDTIYFECNNSENQIIEHPLDAQEVYAQNGTFYCYNEEGDLQLEERDEIFLSITSHYAIYPGEYNLTASMFYLMDERAPFVNISNKGAFDLYYRELDNVEILATINDGSEIVAKWGVSLLSTEDMTFPFSHEDSGIYYFSGNTPIDIQEDNYSLFIFAEDGNGNKGNDSTTLRIDLTSPAITLIQPTGEIYVDIIPVELNVFDAKAGVDESSVEYRIREMNGTSICPESGIGTWDCYNSGWTEISLDGTIYKDNFNASLLGSGEYWFEAKAKDILGNEGVLD